MLLLNHSPSAGHCNGIKYVVVACYDNLIKIKTITGPAAEEVLPLHRFKFLTSMQETEIEFSRIRFPIRPCFGLTVHKVQGQSLEKVGASLMKECFTLSQLYVALKDSLLMILGLNLVYITAQLLLWIWYFFWSAQQSKHFGRQWWVINFSFSYKSYV